MKKAGFEMFVKKFTACILVAALAISTPLTAFAADFSDFFSISDGTDGSDSESETGTVSSTDTNTTALTENAAKITGLILYGYNSDDTIVMKPGDKKVLTAAILTSGSLENATTAQMNKNIRWRSSAPSVVSVSAKTGSMNRCTINARKEGSATITASLDANLDGSYDYIASVNVEVFEASKGNIRWNITDADKFYVKHTYCLSEYLTVDGNVTATDVVTFAVKGSPKAATISGDMLTIKKAGQGDITLVAVLPDSTEVLSGKITISNGSPVKKLTPSKKKVELNFTDEENNIPITEPVEPVSVDVITTDGEETTTDIITWTSNNTAIATVEQDSADQTKAVITANAVGKATITAKSTSGKSAKFSVTVKATLISIGQPYIESGYAWSGKTEELIIPRIPEQNKDKLKVKSLDSKRLKVKSTANGVTITPANDLKLTADEEGADSVDVTITVGPSDKNSEAEPVEATITVKQSDVEIVKVVDVSDDSSDAAKDMNNKQAVRTNPGETYCYEARLSEKHQTPGDCAVSWVSSNAKVATIDNGNLTVVGQGTAKITASSVYKNEKGKYKQSKKTFTIKATPVCDGIEFKSDTAAYDWSKGKKVTINIKQQLPKKANDVIEWYVNGVKQPASKNATDKKLVVEPKVFNGMKEGTVEVMAVSKMDPSVYAVATIYVVKKPAKKVAFSNTYKRGVSLKVGETREIPAPTVEERTCNDPIVSYTVDKKGASIVKPEMTEDGNLKLTGVGEGKATVTARTASGKKGTLKVIVK